MINFEKEVGVWIFLRWRRVLRVLTTGSHRHVSVMQNVTYEMFAVMGWFRPCYELKSEFDWPFCDFICRFYSYIWISIRFVLLFSSRIYGLVEINCFQRVMVQDEVERRKRGGEKKVQKNNIFADSHLPGVVQVINSTSAYSTEI